jgi:mRNA interferase YafQ
MYSLATTKRFDKALKRCLKRGYDMEKLRKVLQLLVDEGKLPPCYRPHKLSGNHDGEWEAHVEPDWLLTWEQNDNELTLLMLSTGTHADLFGKTRK